jgi:hypothetical protein
MGSVTLKSLPFLDSVNRVQYSIDSTELNPIFPPITLTGEGHFTKGHRSFVKPGGHNTWGDDQPITVDEGSGTTTQHIIEIEVGVIVLHKKMLICKSIAH